jgi:hypothetical protein
MSPYNLAVIMLDERVKPFYYLKSEYFYSEDRSWSWAEAAYYALRLPDNAEHILHPTQYLNLIIERK